MALALRLGVGAVILAVVVWRLGAGPFLAGLRNVTWWSLAAAGAVTAATTMCLAWRWSVVARGIGVPLDWRPAVTAYYRSQFLNTVLPGGVLGDVHRAVRHGRDAGDLGRGVRAVVWERVAGQAVQVAAAAVVLSVVPSPMRPAAQVAVVLTVGVALTAAVVVSILTRLGAPRVASFLRATAHDVRTGVLGRRVWPHVAWASAAAVAGHMALFVIAAHTAGSAGSLPELLPVALLVLLAASVPTNIGGWGPREGVAAWSFGAAGLGAGQGVATATVYGVLVMAATAPGAIVLAAARRNRVSIGGELRA